MKTISLILVVLMSVPAAAQESNPTTFPTDAPLALGQSTKLKAGDPAPYSGQLLDEQEQVRRARMNARNEAELLNLKKGNVTISVPVVIAIMAGVLVVGVVSGFGISKATAPKP